MGLKLIEIEKGNERVEAVEDAESFGSSSEKERGEMSIEDLLAGKDREVENSGEFLLILLMTSSFNGVQLPKFANYVRLLSLP